MSWGFAAILLLGVQDVLFAMFVSAMKKASENMGDAVKDVVEERVNKHE